MGEEKEKIQQTDNGQGNEVEKQTAESQEKGKNKKKRLLYALAWSVFVALFFMGAATAVDYKWLSHLLNTVSSAGYIFAAVCLTWLNCLGGIKNISWKKRIAKAVATAILFFGAVLLSVVTWGNVLNQNFEDALFWLVAISWALVSVLIIVKQISLEKQDFDEKPVMSYLFILCGMIYAFAYAVILKFDFDVALKIFYTIHTVVALTVFINIIFKYGIKASNFLQLALFIVSIITLMALLVSTLYFWFWDSYDPEIFTSIMGVFAGLLGGVLTLTGVAWTIKRQDEIRKEEEIESAKPLFSYTVLLKEPKLFELPTCVAFVEDDAENIASYARLDNSEKSTMILKKFYFKKWSRIRGNNLVLKNKSIYLYFYTNKGAKDWDDKNCYMQVEDLLGNLYFYKLNFMQLDQNESIINVLANIKEIPKEKAPDDNN